MDRISFEEMLKKCHDSRSANSYLKDHGIEGVFFRSARKWRLEKRHMFELKIFDFEKDHEFKSVCVAPSIAECIYALKVYFDTNIRKGGMDMKLSDMRVDLKSINYDPNKDTVKVVGARVATDSNQIVSGCNFDILTAAYSRSVVKCPLTEDNRQLVNIVTAMLRTTAGIDATLVNPVLKAYAFISNGNLLSGVSIKADSIELLDDEDLMKP